MRGTIGDTSFDELAEKLEELSSASSPLGRHVSDHINADLQLRMWQDREHRESDATATAYVLNLLYIDTLLGTRSVLKTLDEQGSTIAGKPSKDFLVRFLAKATCLCAEGLGSFPGGRVPRQALSWAILCCGALSGLGVLLSLTAERRSISTDLGKEDADTLIETLSQMRVLKRPDRELANVATFLDEWTKRSYAASATGANEDAPMVFWLLQIFNLYSDVANQLKTVAGGHPLERLRVVELQRDTDDICLTARSGAAVAAEAKVSSWIVGVHAGLVQSLAHDTMCWLAIYLMNSNKVEATRIVEHVLMAVFKDCFAGGKLAVTRAVSFSASPLGSSTETLTILLYCDLFRRARDYCKINDNRTVVIGSLRPSIFADHFDPIVAHLRWLMGKEAQGVHDEDELTAEAAFARIAFVAYATLLCEELLNRRARSELGVQLRPSRPRGDYPPELTFINDDVVNPIKEGGEARINACYSMVWYGPPGTAKTTLAKKIAFDLGWPFLEIGQRDFLREGSDRIDAQADKIFRYCGYLRDVVVLFDELEELILDRETLDDKESRLLTTSMLPRIQELRERRAVVFIFATNRIKTLDMAATRLGRFDIIKYVRLPAPDRKKAMLKDAGKTTAAHYPVLARALDAFVERPNFAKLTDNMAYGDINYLLGQVRRLKPAQSSGEGQSEDEMARLAEDLDKEIVTIFSGHVTSKKLAKALEECDELSEFDRPRYYPAPDAGRKKKFRRTRP